MVRYFQEEVSKKANSFVAFISTWHLNLDRYNFPPYLVFLNCPKIIQKGKWNLETYLTFALFNSL